MSFFLSTKNSPQQFVSKPFISCSWLAQYRYTIHINENTWPTVDLGAGWIILTATGCNLNRTIDTARCEADSEQYKKISDCLGTFSVFGALQAGGYEAINTGQ